MPTYMDPHLAPDAPTGRKRRRRRWKRILLITAGILLFLVVALVIVIAVVAHHLNTPATVPKSFEPATAVPRSATPAIPAGNLVFDSNRTGNYEIWTMDATGAGSRQLTNDATYDSWWARLSPDRRTILFYRTPKGTHDRDYSKTSLWEMAADGTNVVELRPAGLDGWVVQGHAEWSPNGTQLVMFGGSRTSSQIWLTNNLGQDPHVITDRSGSNVDPSWSPDGQTIVFTGCPGSFCPPGDHEVYTIPVTGGQATRITTDSLEDNDPYFSHSGQELAWLTKVTGGLLSVGTWDIRLLPVAKTGTVVAGAAGDQPRRLLNDQNINSKPAWSLDDKTIYFHRAVVTITNGFQIWAIGVDGTGLHELTTGQGGSNEYPGT